MTPLTPDSKDYPTTVDELLAVTTEPVVSINQEGLFVFINEAFEKQFGWSAKELLNKDVTQIMPPYMRDAHKVGISRFLTTEKTVLLGTKLPLAIQYKNGKVEDAEHFIIGDKKDGQWRFAAIINPKH